MKVLVLSSTFPNACEPTRGVFVLERVRRVAARCDMHVVAPVPWFPLNRVLRRGRAAVPRTEWRDGLTVHHPRFLCVPGIAKCLDAALYALSLVPYLRRLRRSFPFDVIDAHFEYPDGVAATLLGRLLRRPVVVTLRGKLVRLAGYRLHRPQLRWMLGRAERVIAVSDDLATRAAAIGARRPIRVIRNGVDATRFCPGDRGEARRALRLPADATIIITVGALYPHKGQHLVIEALPALVREFPALRYVMVGADRPGERHGRDLARLAQRLGVGDRLVFAGRRPHDEIATWLRAADVSLLLSQSEGCPNVVLESMACGVPVVAFGVGGVPELIRDGIDGFVVSYGDRSGFESATHRALATRWDSAGIVRHARGLSWDVAVDNVVDEITHLYASRRPQLSHTEGPAEEGVTR